MSEFKVLTKDEVALVFESFELVRNDLKDISVLEMVQKFKTIGWLIMARTKIDGKYKRVGIAHKQLNKPLFFENKKDADLYAKKARQLLKEESKPKN